MKKAGPLWKVCASTTAEAEEAVMEMFQTVFGQLASSYTDVETGDVTVAVYLSGGKRQKARAVPEPAALKNELKHIQRCGLDIGSGKVSVQRVRREDWAESWKRHFKPIEIASALLIKPGWSRRRAKKGQAVVVLDPGLSFGTGQHPTTAFCLRELVSSFKPRSSSFRPSLLDIGTGSGILAIAAAKLGYRPVDAFDFDPEAVRIARENARKNGVSHKINIQHEDVTGLTLRSNTQYDVVCANLVSTLLTEERQRIVSRLKEGGRLVLAGILKREFRLVQRAYEDAGLRLAGSRIEKEWHSGVFIQRQQKHMRL